MKKLILQSLIVSIALLTCGNLKAQFILDNPQLENTLPDTSAGIDAYISIINQNVNDSVYMRVVRTIQFLAPNHEESFCFGPNCYLPGTDSSSDAAIVPPSNSDNTFHATILPHGACGTTYIHYRFFDINNPADSIGVDMSFGFCTATGVNELQTSYGVSRPSRNPSDRFTSFSYRLNENKGSRIIIYNMLGSLIKSIPLQGKNGEIILNTSDFKSGLYLCSVVNNGSVSTTYKLVVAH